MDEQRQKRKKKIVGLVLLGIFVLFTVGVCVLVGKPMLEFVSEPAKFRDWVEAGGIWGKLAFVGMMAFQVVVAVIPGEPLEIGAGYAFGMWEGTILCLLGALLGSVIVFLTVKKLGMKFVTLFFSEEKIRSLKFLQNEKRLNAIAYLLFLIPGTPKDVMTYVVGLTPMKLPFWIFLTMTARIPSVITSTVGGDALGTQNYGFAIWVFVITAVLGLGGILIFSAVSKRRNRRLALEETSQEQPKKEALEQVTSH